MTTIVIGAGLAGLAAADRLHRGGEEVIVLEAQDHVGGRTRTLRGRLLHEQPADLGASAIDMGHELTLQLCSELGVQLTPQVELFPRQGDEWLRAASPLANHVAVDGRLVDAATRDLVADEVQAALNGAPPGPHETQSAWAARARLTPLARLVLTATADADSLVHASSAQISQVEPLHSDSVRMLEDGADSLAHTLAHGLDVRLGQPARLVRHEGRGFRVTTDHATFTADDVIVATPVTPTLQIGFDPVLPAWKIDALLATPTSQGGMVVGQYADGAELAARLGTGVLSDGPIALAWTRPVGPHDSVVVHGLVPDRADGVLRDEERALTALDDLIAAVTGLTPTRLAGVLQDWTRNPYAGGVGSRPDGGAPRLAAQLGQPIGRLHFAGEHTADQWATGMEGALRSGLRAADEVLLRRDAISRCRADSTRPFGGTSQPGTPPRPAARENLTT